MGIGARFKSIMEFWVIYDGPTDHPGKFVVRRWDILEGHPRPVPHERCYVEESLGAARMRIPRDRMNIGRRPEDDPGIFEVWA